MQTQASEEIDGLAGQFAQLRDGTFVRAGFAINLAVDRGNLVAANDQRVGVVAGNGPGFRFRQAQGEGVRGFAGQGTFVGLRIGNGKRQTQAAEQFAAVRRG